MTPPPLFPSTRDLELAARRSFREPTDVDTLDARVTRALGQVVAQRINGTLFSPGPRLDRAVREIAHPTLQAEQPSPAQHEITKTHTLHPPAHDETPAAHFAQPCLPTSGTNDTISPSLRRTPRAPRV